LSKIILIKNTTYLATLLIVGIITVLSPLSSSSFMTAEVQENNVYVIWRDTYSPDIFVAVSNDNGHTFSTLININNTAEISLFPQISTEGNNKYIVWRDTYSLDIFVAVSNDNGHTFSTPININNNEIGLARTQISSTP
jgi:hypothetical protein